MERYREQARRLRDGCSNPRESNCMGYVLQNNKSLRLHLLKISLPSKKGNLFDNTECEPGASEDSCIVVSVLHSFRISMYSLLLMILINYYSVCYIFKGGDKAHGAADKSVMRKVAPNRCIFSPVISLLATAKIYNNPKCTISSSETLYPCFTAL